MSNDIIVIKSIILDSLNVYVELEDGTTYLISYITKSISLVDKNDITKQSIPVKLPYNLLINKLISDKTGKLYSIKDMLILNKSSNTLGFKWSVWVKKNLNCRLIIKDTKFNYYILYNNNELRYQKGSEHEYTPTLCCNSRLLYFNFLKYRDFNLPKASVEVLTRKIADCRSIVFNNLIGELHFDSLNLYYKITGTDFTIYGHVDKKSYNSVEMTV